MTNPRFLQTAGRWMNKEPPADIIEPERIIRPTNLENVLVFSGGKEIFVIDRDSSIKEVASRENSVRALCSHNGTLYDGGGYNKIFNTLSNEEVASRTSLVLTLCSHNGILYDGGFYNKIFNTLSSKEVASRTDWVYALCSHNGILYDGGSYNGVFNTLSSKAVASRTSLVLALCSHPRKYFVEAGV